MMDENSPLTGEIAHAPAATHERSSLKKWMSIVLVSVLVLAGLSTLTRDDVAQPSAELNLQGSAAHTPRPCTWSECTSSKCSPSTAPYTCLKWNGGPHGGCSSTPWLVGTCDDQCSLTSCSTLPTPPGTATCSKPCPKSHCALPSLCGLDVPYQCLEGSAANGCSDDEMHWTVDVQETTCGECCDVSSCF